MKHLLWILVPGMIFFTQCTKEDLSDSIQTEEVLDADLRAKTTFTVRIETVHEGDFVTPFAPGVWIVQKKRSAPMFKSGEPNFMNGLEELAEDGMPGILNAAMSAHPKVKRNGIFNTPVGEANPAPIFPGEAYEFTFRAGRFDRLNFATMFIQSNDLFVAPDESGLALFDRYKNPISGDITNQLYLWDAGTEVNEEPGVGPNQAPRQSGPNTGEDENGVVRTVSDGFDYPDLHEVIKVTITPIE